MEVGRHSALGAGELWMQTEDSLIAQNMHTMIIRYFILIMENKLRYLLYGLGSWLSESFVVSGIRVIFA